MKAIVLSTKSSIHRPSLRRGFRLIPLVLVCFGLAPMAQAVGPDTDGNIPGSNNGEGIGVLVSRTTGVWNTGTGFEALNHLTAGNQNTATGLRALNSDINGGYNTATGVYSLFSNTSGFFNSATGAYALANNTTGSQNTANGYGALYRNTAGNNTAIGFGALFRNTTGSDNTAVGDEALSNNTDGNSNTALGFNAGTDPGIVSNNIYVGDPGFPGDENVISIGGIAASGTPYALTFIGGIYGSAVNTGTALPVYVDTDGHLGTTLVNGSAMKLRMRTPKGAQPQVKVNEFQKQQKRIAELENAVARLAATVKEQAAQIEKVSAQMEFQKPAQRVVANKE
ncbi:MAG: hypothetical protein E6L08_01460 [Verrucomicrobia bacterium]|nr:MAG: hypothetical protein E6L08_01460 [Verrucomicrobiota bacterium]